jgi:copper homeostasis protein
MINKILEICCYSVESAINAEKSGAGRIELCDNYSEGGTTPSYATIQHTIIKTNIPVNVIVRPRGGDFLYSNIEYELIKEDILQIKNLHANGIVIGFLKSDGNIDIERTQEIVDLAKPMEVTFHRAFDMCSDPFLALEQLKGIGVKRILTSGCKNTAMEGIDQLTKFVDKSVNNIIIMPGSGVNENNFEELMSKTGAMEFHSSAKMFENTNMQYLNRDISMGGVDGVDEFKMVSVDTDSIKAMIKILKPDL